VDAKSVGWQDRVHFGGAYSTLGCNICPLSENIEQKEYREGYMSETSAKRQQVAGEAPAVRYDGSAVLNVRSVAAVCKLLAVESLSEPLSWAQQ
jgi:hypothetical protein